MIDKLDLRKVSNTHATLQRLLAVSWKPDFKRWKSHKVLLVEYFRRGALWAKALNVTAEWPIIDFAAQIDPTVRADNSIMDTWQDHLLHTNPTNYVPKEMGFVLESALHWVTLEDNHLTEPYNLPQPYEPVIVMYERGGFFYRLPDGIGITSVTAIARRGWQHYDRNSPFESIDVQHLDQIDSGVPEFR